jgi:putative hydrolase of HD superfamily
LRSGWKVWELDADRFESVAEHIYGTQMLALAVNAEFNLGLDIARVALMLSIHELGETVVGDFPSVGRKVSQEQKHKMELAAVETILKPLDNSEMIKAAFLEFENRQTKEAKFAYFMDKLDCSMQCKFYEESGCTDYDKERTGVFKELIEEGKAKGYKSFAKTWIEYDKEHFNFDELLVSIADYIAENEIYGLK